MSGNQDLKRKPGPYGQIERPSKRQTPLSSLKPPFDDYHRFTEKVNCPVEDLKRDESLVLKSTQLKQKSLTEDYEAESSEWISTPGYAEVVKSPFRTPLPGKGGRIYSRSKVPKYSGSTPQTPITNAGSPSGTDLIQAGTCRYNSSLGLLTKKFINLIKSAEDGILDLNQAADILQVQKRRIYDITNVLEGIGLIEKTLKNKISWKGFDDSGPGESDSNILQTQIENLSMEEHKLDDRIRETQERLRDLGEDDHCQKWLFVTEEDIKSLPCFQNETLIAIKAPHGTTLEVPDPDEIVDDPQKRYRIVLRSTMGPIDVYLVSQFEEKFEELDGSDSPVRNPLSSASRSHEKCQAAAKLMEEARREEMQQKGQENNRMSPELIAAQDFVGGITKIVPSDIDSDADYWLLSDAGISITDMWKTDLAGAGWSEMGVFGAEEFVMTAVSVQREQTPPSGIIEVSSATNSYCS